MGAVGRPADSADPDGKPHWRQEDTTKQTQTQTPEYISTLDWLGERMAALNTLISVSCLAAVTPAGQVRQQKHKHGFHVAGGAKGVSTATAFVLVSALCLMGSPTAALCMDNAANDIQNVLKVLDNTQVSKDVAAKQPVSVMWGIADTTATAGKLFQFTLPKEAFKGEITKYKVTEVNQDRLPKWLDFDEAKQTLTGVPDQEDIGEDYYVEVTALGPVSSETHSQAKDIFTISVVEDKVHAPDTAALPLKEANIDGLKPIKCPEGSSVTMVTIIVDTDMSGLRPLEKVGLMRGMCSHLKIPTELLRFLPVGNKPMFDSSALVAGPGDVKSPQYSGAVLQWEVGCGNVYANHMPILQQVESTSHDGSMSNAVGRGIIGWHVTNNKPHVPHRMKRQAAVMPTATLGETIGPPTRQPVPTVVIDETDQPVTRVVPSMMSPTFPGEIQPTKIRPHKHHHRSKTKGRHLHKTKHPKHSPTRKHHHKTKLPKTVMPTATMLPIQPTRAIDIIPTLLESAMERPLPTYDVASPGVSRTEDLLEPSMTATLPPAKTGATMVLPTRTLTMPDIMITEPIEPSRTDSLVTPPTLTPPVAEVTEKPSPIRTPKPVETTEPWGPTEEPFNYAPILKNDIDRILVTVGDILFYKVPKDTFYDFEDGNTKNLKLVFLTIDGLTLPRSSWVNFNQTTQTIYGLPLPQHEGRQEYLMAAIDQKGKIARDAFEIVVSRRSHQKINHEFSLTLDLDYQKFVVDLEKRLDVARKLASVYGDKDTSNMIVTRIEPGSVVYAWTNRSVPLEPCPTSEISKLVSYLVIASNNSINPALTEKMKPYKITRVGAEAKGVCADEEMPKVDSSRPRPGEGADSAPAPRDTSDEDVLITTVVPAVVIAAMLLLAGLIACFLYRKKRKGKLSDEDQHTFVNKGIPIIFADELDDKPDPPTKPLIMDDEKPPLPPPEYPRSSSGSAPSTPGSDKKDLIETTEDERDDTDMTSPLYQPPPPFPGNRENRQHRPRVQTSYRNPPPYVPP